jgi:hypothetical protein
MITIQQMIACAARELKMRESAYPRWVASGKMKPLDAENETAVMRAILENLRAQAPAEPEQVGLFG